MSLDLYKKMVLVRVLEDKLQELCYTGEAGDLHFNKGQEAISIGVTSVLRPTDYMVTHHRTIAHAIGKGMDLNHLVAEILGRATGPNGGRAGEMHIHDYSINYMFSFQLVGTAIPVSAGVAWASKYVKKEDAVTAVFFGDAATSNGQFHEGLNIAAVRKVPLLLVLEDNHIAGNIRPDIYLPTHIGQRFESYGIPVEMVDGNRLEDVIYVARTLREEVALTGRPRAMVCDTTRLCWHKQGQRDVRPKEEIDMLAQRDPIIHMIDLLNLTLADRDRCWKEASEKVEEALKFARESPWPTA